MLVSLLQVGRLQAADIPTYAWRGELVATDPNSNTLTIRVKMPAHVLRYVDQFKPGDRVVLVWKMPNGDTHADELLMIDTGQLSNGRRLDSGYILPAEFVSADKTTVTAKLHVDDKMLQAARSLANGAPIQATASVHEESDMAALITIGAADGAVGGGAK